jgi:hypothetical protein
MGSLYSWGVQEGVNRSAHSLPLREVLTDSRSSDIRVEQSSLGSVTTWRVSSHMHRSMLLHGNTGLSRVGLLLGSSATILHVVCCVVIALACCCGHTDTVTLEHDSPVRPISSTRLAQCTSGIGSCLPVHDECVPCGAHAHLVAARLGVQPKKEHHVPVVTPEECLRVPGDRLGAPSVTGAPGLLGLSSSILQMIWATLLLL